MSRVIHFMFIIFLSLMVTSSCAPVSNQTTVKDKVAEFYCASNKLKDIINDLIKVISISSKHVLNE